MNKTTSHLPQTLAILAAALLPAAAHAGGGQTNIDKGLPLHLEDTSPADYLGREFQIVTRYDRTHEGEDDWRVEGRVEYGIWYNTEISVAAPFLFGGAYEHDGLGPIDVEVLYNLNQESLSLPAIAFAGGVEFTNAARAGGGDGVDPYVALILDRTIGESSLYHRVHLNALYQFNGSQRDNERDGRYEVALGYSVRLGASTLVLADIVRMQEMEQDVEVNLAEIGFRFATTPQSVFSTGVGFGFGDESPDARVTLGFQYEF